jgi:hypothetical protein
MSVSTPAEIKAANNERIQLLRARIEELKNDIKQERKVKDDCHGINAADHVSPWDLGGEEDSLSC